MSLAKDTAKDMLIEQGLKNTAKVGGLEINDKTKGDVLFYAKVGQVVNIILGLIGIVMMYFIILAGYIWMTSEGDAGKLKEAKVRIKNAIFGLVLISLAYAIADFIISKFNK